MSKSIRSFLSFLLVLQLIIPYSTFAAAVGEFTSVVGNVTQTRAKEVIRPVAKSTIELKDLIVTARTSSATMVFSDDSTITLSENTKLEIKGFLFKDKSRRGIFSLAIGKLTANVKKYIGSDNVFEVHSPTAVVGVRGTGFEFVEATKDGMATVTCMDGSLTMSALSATGEVISTAVLEAGQVAVIIGGVITISKIGAAAAATAIARTTEAGTAGATGGAAAAGGGAGATGLSTAAITGIALSAIAVVGITAAAIRNSVGGGSSSTPCSNTDGRWNGTYSATSCTGAAKAPGTWVMNCSRCSCSGTWTDSDGYTNNPTCTTSDNLMSCVANTTDCTGNPCQVNQSGPISGNSLSGTYSGCYTGNWTGAKQ